VGATVSMSSALGLNVEGCQDVGQRMIQNERSTIASIGWDPPSGETDDGGPSRRDRNEFFGRSASCRAPPRRSRRAHRRERTLARFHNATATQPGS